MAAADSRRHRVISLDEKVPGQQTVEKAQHERAAERHDTAQSAVPLSPRSSLRGVLAREITRWMQAHNFYGERDVAHVCDDDCVVSLMKVDDVRTSSRSERIGAA